MESWEGGFLRNANGSMYVSMLRRVLSEKRASEVLLYGIERSKFDCELERSSVY